MSHDLGKYSSFINFYMNFDQGCYKTLPLVGTLSSVFNNTYNQQGFCKKRILPIKLSNISHYSIYNDHPGEKKTNMTT